MTRPSASAPWRRHTGCRACVPGGWIATKDAALIQRLIAVREHITNTLGEHTAPAVLRDPEQFREHARARVRQNKTIVAGHIASNPRMDRGKSVAGMVGPPRIVDADEKACREAYRHLAEDLDALVVPASGFELPDTFFRVGFGGDQDALKPGLERLGTARKILNSDEHKRATAG